MASSRTRKVSKKALIKIQSILACITSNRGSEIDFDFFHDVMGLVWIETFGTDAGFAVLNEWAINIGNDEEVPTGQELWECWSLYEHDHERYFGMGKLTKLVQQPKKKKNKT